MSRPNSSSQTSAFPTTILHKANHDSSDASSGMPELMQSIRVTEYGIHAVSFRHISENEGNHRHNRPDANQCRRRHQKPKPNELQSDHLCLVRDSRERRQRVR